MSIQRIFFALLHPYNNVLLVPNFFVIADIPCKTFRREETHEIGFYLSFKDAVVWADDLSLMQSAVSDDVVWNDATNHFGHWNRTVTARCSFSRLWLPLVVRQHRRLYRLLMHVALPGTVVRPAVVYHVSHVMCHVIASWPLLFRDILTLLHAQNFRQSLDGDLHMGGTRNASTATARCTWLNVSNKYLTNSDRLWQSDKNV